MIAEPYICIKGSRPGEIQWYDIDQMKKPGWSWSLGVAKQPYADFEREKLAELGAKEIKISGNPYDLQTEEWGWNSSILIQYNSYRSDSESSRLLKRAEFLKAVCEEEGVEWLPKPYTAEDVEREIQKEFCNKCGAENGMFDEGKWWCWPCWEKRKGLSKPGRDYYTKEEINAMFSDLKKRK